MRREHQERFFELERLVADGDLPFLHGFEQRALNFGGRAVDFVGKHEVGKDGAAPGGKRARLRIVDLRADDVGGQHVRGELQSGEAHVNGGRQGFDREGLGQSRDPFEQDMAVGQQPYDEPLDQVFLTDDDLVDFVEQRRHEQAGLLHLGIDGAYSGIHFSR